MNNKIKVSQYAKLKIYWDDKPENYSRESKLKIRNYFASKYGIDKGSINVIYRPVKIGKNGEVIEINGAGIDNIMDKNYQVSLMKQWYDREGKTIDFNRLVDLDNKVNGSLDGEFDVVTHRSWELKWMFIDNFLSFGEKNYISFSKLSGLNIVTSEPPNQGGKTNFTVDSIKFLLYGRTTKTDKNEDIFNTFTDKDTLVVRGMLEIDGEELIIERKLSRTAKKSGGWTVVNKVNYYTMLPDGEEELKNEEDAKKTTEKIRQTIGTEKDFDITVLATGRNLEDLIEAKNTENGRLLTKFIGLEIIEKKEEIAKKMNSDFNKTKKGNNYSIVTLLSDNELQEMNLKLYSEALIQHKENLKIYLAELDKLENSKDLKLGSKLAIDVTISQLNPENIERDITKITEKGLEYKAVIDELNIKIKALKDASYDEDKYHKLIKDNTTLSISINDVKSAIARYKVSIDNLKNGEICQSCKRPLADVDHSAQIAADELSLKTKEEVLIKLNGELDILTKEIDLINTNRLLVNDRNKLELEKDKNEVEIGLLRAKITANKADLVKYKANESVIKSNLDIDLEVSAIKTNIIVENRKKDETTQKIFITESSITSAENAIVTNNGIILVLKGEEEIEKVFKVYLEMIGKKGISKLVLRSVLPIINSELQRLLDDVCDFEIELFMTDKNEVEYLLIKSGVEKLLKSGSGLETTIASLALRCVLSKVSYLPMPNFITFDEILGKVAAINIEKLKPMFEKIKGMFDIVFFITHNDLVKDWADNIIVINKINDVSAFNTK